MKNTFVAIMAGGIGSRFWPKSRTGFPKQFLDFLNTGQTLIQLTYERFLKVCPKENIYVITNEMYAGIVAKQLPGLADHQLLKEPVRRNTAPCITYVSDKIHTLNPDANIIVGPSDHIILKEEKFYEVIKKGLSFVSKNDALLTLGIHPTRPDTGYGYIQYYHDDAPGSKGPFKVKTFTEKPTLEIAKTFLASGDFSWNSGMFMWSVKSIKKALKKHLPEIESAFKDGKKFYNSPKEAAFIKTAYSHCTNISIDFGVMEKAKNVYVIPSEFGWSDVGTWGSLYDIYEKDYLGNAVMGNNVKIYDSANNMIMVPKEKLVVLQGLENFVVVDTEDVLLICDKENEQEIKQITSDIKRNKLDEFL